MPWTSLLKLPAIFAVSHEAAAVLIPPPSGGLLRREQDQYETRFPSSFKWMQLRKIVRLGASINVAFIVLASIIEAGFLLAAALPSHHAASKALSIIYGADAQASLSFLFLLGASIALLGSYIRKACFRELGSLFTFDLTIRDGHKLVTTGPYAIVRHPSYTGLMFVLAGLTICELAPGSWWIEAGVVHTNPGKIIAALWVLQVIALTAAIARAPIEDAALRQEFKEEWRAYAHKVPYLYIPSIL